MVNIVKVCNVQFKRLGRRYYFSCERVDVSNGDMVVVNTIRGPEVGYVCGEAFDYKAQENQEIKPVIRKATKDDIRKLENNRKDEEAIVKKTKEFVIKERLEMKVLAAEYTLDRSKLLIYFESEDRVDFRELVKDLADVYKTRIELRQVGSRDGARYFGGMGPCGLKVCCQTFLVEFDNVSIKMAKNQNLSLNPVKISGNCGKLLCCINYENDLYTELRKSAPNEGDIVDTDNGKAKVVSSDVLNKSLKVKYLDNEGIGYLKFEDVKFDPKNRKPHNNNQQGDNKNASR